MTNLFRVAATKHVIGAANDEKVTAQYFAAVKAGDIATVCHLKDSGISFDATNADDQTGMHLAATLGHTDLVAVLVKLGAKTVVRDSDGRTPMHFAADKGHIGVVNLLAELLDPPDDMGDTAMHHAARKGRIDVANVLIEHRHPFHLANRNGDSPLNLAIEYGHADLAEFFVKHGASYRPAAPSCSHRAASPYW